MLSISYPLAFLAGLLSFLSPCVLPLVPVYLSYLSGSSLHGGAPPNRRQVLSNAVLFVAGFALVFIALFGLPTTLLGTALQQYSGWIGRIGGAILILFGLHTTGIITIAVFSATRRLEAGSAMEPGYARSMLLGVTFAAGWTPCVGPLLGTVMTLAFTEPSRALGFLSAYAFGMAVPFLTTAALLAQAVGWLKRLNRYVRAIEIASGLLMVGVGVLLISGTFTMLNSLLIRVTPEWLLQYL
jgi:cytochrome c-type biogenesis protein